MTLPVPSDSTREAIESSNGSTIAEIASKSVSTDAVMSPIGAWTARAPGLRLRVETGPPNGWTEKVIVSIGARIAVARRLIDEWIAVVSRSTVGWIDAASR
jgi:hypothetical protein